MRAVWVFYWSVSAGQTDTAVAVGHAGSGAGCDLWSLGPFHALDVTGEGVGLWNAGARALGPLSNMGIGEVMRRPRWWMEVTWDLRGRTVDVGSAGAFQ